MKPTTTIKWFRAEGNYVNGKQPLAQIACYYESGPNWYCLKQLWIDDEGNELWKDIEVVQ
jgi:hypothetical protein